MLWQPLCKIGRSLKAFQEKQKTGCVLRTHPAKIHIRYVQQGVPHRERSVFLCLGYDEPVPPATRQTPAGLPRCSSRQGWLGRMPVPDVRWLHRDKGKCLWTFSFCSNARSFDRPTVAKPGEKIKVPIFIRRKGTEVFCPALAFGGFVDGLQVPFVMRLFHRSAVLQTVPYMPYAV